MDRELMATTESDGKLRARIFRMARHFAPRDESALKATVVMVAALFVGPDEEKIVPVTGYSGEYVAEVVERLRVSGLWSAEGRLDYGDWSNSPKGMVRYALDLAVALGIVVRTNQKRDGEYVYESQIYENSKL
jgi:DNA helicase HerA-like ATPase